MGSNGIDAVITARTLENFVKLGKTMQYMDAAKMSIFQVKIEDDEMQNAIKELFNKVIWIKWNMMYWEI